MRRVECGAGSATRPSGRMDRAWKVRGVGPRAFRGRFYNILPRSSFGSSTHCSVFNDRGRTVKLRIDSPADARTSPRTSHCRRTDEAVRVAGKRGQGVKRDGVEDRGVMVDGVGQ